MNSHRKLLDMLYGWGLAVDNDSLHNRMDESDDIGDLYQEAGAMAPGDDEQVKNFIIEKIIPFLLKE